MIFSILAFLNANKNVGGAIALVLLGVTIVSGSYMAGERHRDNVLAVATAKTNGKIVEQRGKDEAEIAAQDADAARIDAAVKAELALKKNERFILDEDTAALLRKVGG
jgi:hypothetical protein